MRPGERGAPPLLSVAGLRLAYGDVQALDGVGFELIEGEILGLIGPNGAGKTTLLECLAGFVAPNAGEVRLRGQALPLARRREQLFYLPDGITPFGDLSVGRVLTAYGRLHGQPRALLASLVEGLDLAPVWRKTVAALSKGYRRRLLLALGLLAPQPILLLDEPFDGFDLRQTLAVVELLREVARRRTLLLSIHQLADAERICDRFLLLAEGRSLACGSLAALRERSGAPGARLEEVFLALT